MFRQGCIGVLVVMITNSCEKPPLAPTPEVPEKKAGPAAAAESGEALEFARKGKGKKGKKRPRGSAGQFDFYVMSLSWSPGYCATPAGQRDDLQCAPNRHFAFVLHGLWPQYEKGGWPQDCGAERMPDDLIPTMLDIMPSPRLVDHEWTKHGSCSGLSPEHYLEESREAFEKVKIPGPYRAPLQQVMISPEAMRAAFTQANPEFGPLGFAVLCSGNGRYLQEVRACLTKDLTGRACSAEVLKSACRSSQVIMRPVR